MGYTKFKKLKTVVDKFHLSAYRKPLFSEIEKIALSSWLSETLKISELLPLTNEKAERIISPILTEIARAYTDKISFFSGEELNVNAKEDLSGECDFFFTLVPQSAYFEMPIISLVEAKDEDMEYGIAQCSAQLYGAKLLNQRENKEIPFLYGCATTGIEWQFMRFEKDTFWIDTKKYTDVGEVLGVWHCILQEY